MSSNFLKRERERGQGERQIERKRGEEREQREKVIYRKRKTD